MPVRIIGAGLAGCEAAWQLVSAGIEVEIYEMRPTTMTPAHKTGGWAELVCSNSLGAVDLYNASGLLKAELKKLGSLLIRVAQDTALPAGGALAVDRSRFSALVEGALKKCPLIKHICKEITEIPTCTPSAPVIVATGPLTSEPLAYAIRNLTGHGGFSFYDAISPIVTFDSLDLSCLFSQSRYDKGNGADYLNVPMDRDLYYQFVENVKNAQKHTGHLGDLDRPGCESIPFEGCMPIEDMVQRGVDTLRYGPLKPTGLIDPRTGKRPFAVLQLRQDNQDGTLWNMVGMQTRMQKDEQKRVFRSLPALKEAEFVRFGSVHRNTFINSPHLLDENLQFKKMPGLYFAGQITGVEGYVESIACGLAVGRNLARLMRGEPPTSFPRQTAIGALLAYVTQEGGQDFQPMNINYGLISGYIDPSPSPNQGRRFSKKERRLAIAQYSLSLLANV